MNNWKLDDNFESGGLTLLDGSFRLQDVTNNKTLEEGKDYTLTIKPDHEGFLLELIGDYATTNSQLKITYTTNMNADFSNENVKTRQNQRGLITAALNAKIRKRAVLRRIARHPTTASNTAYTTLFQKKSRGKSASTIMESRQKPLY